MTLFIVLFLKYCFILCNLIKKINLKGQSVTVALSILGLHPLVLVHSTCALYSGNGGLSRVGGSPADLLRGDTQRPSSPAHRGVVL